MLLATEWLDNVPLDVAVHTADGWRYVLVDPESGAETLGEPVEPRRSRLAQQVVAHGPKRVGFPRRDRPEPG